MTSQRNLERICTGSDLDLGREDGKPEVQRNPAGLLPLSLIFE